MGYRFSLLTLLFSGVFAQLKPVSEEKLRLLLQNFSNVSKHKVQRDLFRYGQRTGSHELGETGILAQLCKLHVLVHVINPFITFLHRSSQVL